MAERRDLDNRTGFDRVTDQYRRARHGYPPALFDQLFSLLPDDPQVVEVGPGTGQATRDLVDRGATVTAVEIGPSLAARLRADLGGDDGLREVVVAPFERSALPARSFDAVFSATAYHWIPTWAQTAEPARILRPGGVLAVVDTIQVESDVDDGFWERVQPIFARRGAGRRPDDPKPGAPEDATPAMWDVLRRSDEFTDVDLERYRWDQRYTAVQYDALHRTYSGWLAMAPDEGEALLADIRALIDGEFGGEIVRPLVITLLTSRRR